MEAELKRYQLVEAFWTMMTPSLDLVQQMCKKINKDFRPKPDTSFNGTQKRPNTGNANTR